MRALSVRQPWATLIARGEKTVETREWETHYRGPLLICSAKRWALGNEAMDPNEFPLGMALCTAVLVDCHRMGPDDVRLSQCAWNTELYAWVLADIRRIEPFPVRGMPGLFNVPGVAF